LYQGKEKRKKKEKETFAFQTLLDNQFSIILDFRSYKSEPSKSYNQRNVVEMSDNLTAEFRKMWGNFASDTSASNNNPTLSTRSSHIFDILQQPKMADGDQFDSAL
jgi:hypothetical protein